MRWLARVWWVSAALVAACDDGAEETAAAGTSSGGSTEGDGGFTQGSGGGADQSCGSTDKVDLLLAVDDSRSMADKQEVLATAVPDLIGWLINPPCVDAEGAITLQPASAAEPCPERSLRQFKPIEDLHVGIIASSLGSHGGDACTGATTTNEYAHLLARDALGAAVPSYQDLAFLAWDPLAQLDPPGDGDAAAFTAQLGTMVIGVGQTGCGYEAQLESVHRFLVAPDPYETIVVEDGAAVPMGIDETVLEQRAAFLRPDSLLAIVLLSDENDCSIRDGGSDYLVAQLGSSYHLARPRGECATDPADPCCKPCDAPLDGCPADPSCDLNGGKLDATEDIANLRCFEQKRRFGTDFLQPLDRYVAALSDGMVTDRAGELVPNPIFSDLPGLGAPVRNAGLVFVTALVGVPWQDLARRNAGGEPDLAEGLDPDGKPIGGYQSAAELTDALVWPLVIGDPAQYEPPSDPYMVESQWPRSGEHPIIDAPIAPPGSPAGASPINGHEYANPNGLDLQYACIFALPTAKDCIGAEQCDCGAAEESPLCQNPATNGYETTQFAAKAYPSIRELALVERLGERGLAASICPAQLSDPSRRDYGYRPAVATLIETIEPCLEPDVPR